MWSLACFDNGDMICEPLFACSPLALRNEQRTGNHHRPSLHMAGSLIQVRATRLRQAHGTETGVKQMHLTVRDVFARACLVIFGYQEDGSHSCGTA